MVTGVGWRRRFHEAEVALNDGLGCMQKLTTATATATSTMSIGTGDRTENEQNHPYAKIPGFVSAENEQYYLRKALTLLNKMLCEEDREGYELVTVDNK